MPSILITGASRGLGLEFAREYAAAGWKVHAACRDPEQAPALAKLKGNIVPHRLDVRSVPQIATLKSALGQEPLDILLNNAGIYGPRDSSIAALDDDDWLDTFHVNSIAPLRIADALAENVARSEKKLMIFITSQMGSIARSAGGAQPYRMSKAALNAGVRSLSFELAAQGIACVVLHPGWVRTDMGGPGGTLDVKTSVGHMRKVIEGLGPKDNGRFLDHEGNEVPW
ncbi:MAG TPA: SDR family oxidoreductase [Alphaproteobacteria bacterium]|nr:SDR family oxidoreductase [Alphaproteobacteria bacterium]